MRWGTRCCARSPDASATPAAKTRSSPGTAGDDVVIVSRRAWNVVDVPVLADRVFAATTAPIDLSALDERLRVGVSIGIAVSHDGDTATAFLARADEAAYRAKRAGKGQIRY